MGDLNFEIYKEDNSELDKYLSDSIISYGMEQLKGNKPKKLYCCYKESNGKMLGAVMGNKTLNLFYISHLFVEPKNRNKGLATKLLSGIEKAALEEGCDILRLNTFNKKAHKLYINAGFEETVCISDYMNGFNLVYYHKKIS